MPGFFVERGGNRRGAGDVPPGSGALWKWVTDPEKYDYWQKALQWDSAFQMQYLRDFPAAIEWWRPEPAHELIRNQPDDVTRRMVFAKTAAGGLAVAYLPNNETIELDVSAFPTPLKGHWSTRCMADILRSPIAWRTRAQVASRRRRGATGFFCWSRRGCRSKEEKTPMENRWLLTAFSALIAMNLATARARTFYVAPGGDDGNSGALESPLRTIPKAGEVARAGDTVLVRNGLYKGLVLLRFSGEPDRPIVFKNAPGERPVVDGAGHGRIELQSEQGWRKPIGWITVEGFEVRNGWDGIKFYNAHHIVLKGNFIHDNANQGILGNGHHIRIEGNIIARNGFKPDNEKSNKEHGIYATGTDFEIVNNLIHSNRAYGIQVAGYPFKPDSHAGPEFAAARRWLISHNTIALQQNRAGIVVWQEDATECVIEDNILCCNAVTLGRGDCQGIDFVAAGGRHVIRNNLFWSPGRTSISGETDDYTASDNLEDEDPRFVDVDRFDFHLREGSPAIDSGGTQGAAATDLDGIPRPQGKACDIGAFEHSEQ